MYAGLALLCDAVVPVVYGVSMTVLATAAAVLGDLAPTNRQENPDGTAENGAQGAIAGLGALTVGAAVWTLPTAPAVVAGPFTALVGLLAAVLLTMRRMTT
jgi:hypothetical protein